MAFIRGTFLQAQKNRLMAVLMAGAFAIGVSAHLNRHGDNYFLGHGIF
jgi:hypothetical protein